MTAFIFAIICVISRSLLNVFDRKYFKEESHSLVAGIFWNALYPFFLAICCSFLFRCDHHRILHLIFNPAFLLSGLFAQLAAFAFSYSFKKMSVRAVVVSSKLADLTIPMVLLPWTPLFDFSSYFFAFLSTCAFLPIFLTLHHHEERYDYSIIFLIIFILSMQALINTYFHISSYSKNILQFLEVFTAILFWRTFFCTIGLLQTLKNNYKILKKQVTATSNQPLLFLRSLIAFLSQGAFFYSITRESGNMVWPILNASPLISTSLAALILKERFGKPETISTMSYLSLLFFYLVNYGGLK